MSKLIDLTGEQFGFLTVVERVPDAKPAKWVCKCVCGNKTEVTGSNLRRGHTKSCGCIKGTGIIGRRVGYLVVVEHLESDKYRCICDCGNYCVRSYKSIAQSESMYCDECGRKIRVDALLHGGTFVSGTQPGKLHSKPTKANKSGVVGVNYDKSRGKWMAGIRFQGQKYNLGRFDSFEDAVEARKKAEKEIFGNFLEWYEQNYNKDKSPSE